MVNSIKGILTFRAIDQLGIDTGGIEWAVDTSSTTLSALPKKGEEIHIFTYLHHTQDQMKLFGFGTVEERSVFLALLKVNGVGPSLAKKILSGITSERFQAAVDSEDLAVLGSIPGLGKKTAQKIVLQLKGKLTDNADGLSGGISEVVEALSSMGFESRGAAKAVAEILNDKELELLSDDNREKEILRRAIIALSS